jgi:acetyl esterase/lipase
MQYIAGNPNAGTLSPEQLIPPPDPRETEDCLFLDVLVPKAVFDNRQSNKGLAPVMVWIYGGGFTFSYKGNDGDPSTIIKSSQQSEDTNGVIYVAFNYRVSQTISLRDRALSDNILGWGFWFSWWAQPAVKWKCKRRTS